MIDEPQPEDGELSPQGLEALLRLLIEGAGRRIVSATIDGRVAWIKRFGLERRPFAKKVHALVSPLVLHPFLRASKEVGPEQMAEREIRKTNRFRAAGLPAAAILYSRADILVLSNVEAIVQRELNRLKPLDPAAHDALLTRCAVALATAHAAGLCHGRPHPRDMMIDGGTIGFLDFEEEPEGAMPLAVAQARDVWLLFQQICGQALLPDTPTDAFAAYRALAPLAVAAELRRLVRFFGVFTPVLRALRRIHLGADGQRLLKATEFLRASLDERGATGKTTGLSSVLC